MGHQRYRSDESHFATQSCGYEQLPTSEQNENDTASICHVNNTSKVNNKDKIYIENLKVPEANVNKHYLKVPSTTSANVSFVHDGRSASTSNLKSFASSTNGLESKKKSASIVQHSEILDRFRMALDNYGNF